MPLACRLIPRRRALLPVSALLAVCLAILNAIPALAATPNPYSHFKLANGLDVYIIHDHRLPIVSHSIWYRVGSADEREGEAGLAHFLEHLLFKGTEKNSAAIFTRFAGTNGGSQNAVTTNDTTYYYQRVPKDKLRQLMELEADRMAGLKLTEKDVNVERGAVLEELRRNQNNPFFKLTVAVNEVIHADTPYSRHPIGYEADIKAMTHASALAFYQRYYAPNNAVVIIAGDVTLPQVKALAEATYGQVKAREVVPRVAHKLVLTPARSRVIVDHDQVRTPSVAIRFAIPGTLNISQDDEAALVLLGSVLSTGQTSRLHRQLVETRIATSARAGAGTYRGAGRFSFDAGAAQGTSADALEKALRAAIDDLRKNPIAASEIDELRPLILKSRAEQLDNQFGRLELLGALLMEDRTLADVIAWDARIDRVTAADLKRMVETYLRDDRSVTAHLLPQTAPAAPKQ